MKLATLFIFSYAFTFAHAVSAGKRFIFRQDDVEDFFHSDYSVTLMDFFMERNIGVSVGIIGSFVNGDDPVLYSALQRCVAAGSDKCALFNHGSDAAYIFGTAASVEEAKEQIQGCDTKIRSLFPGYRPQLFAPHQNSWNLNAELAVKELGYDAISASELLYSGMSWNLSSTPIQMPQHATTAAFTEENTWEGLPVSRTVSDCLTAAATDNYCVIMTHPHEFADGVYNFTMLQNLIDQLYANGFTSTNFPTVIREIKGGNPPTPSPTSGPALRKRFIFRQDDIQDFYESTEQVALLNFFMDNEISVTAGIIGNAFNGLDTTLTTALQRCAALSSDKCSLANRGSDSSYLLTSATSVTEAKAQIVAADAKIKSIFPGYSVQTFIPYQNKFNQFTLDAVKELGYDSISASTQKISGMNWDLTSNPLHLPSQVAITYYPTPSTSQAYTTNEIISVCQLAAIHHQDCVITINAHDLAAGAYSLTLLQQLVNGLKADGFSSINLATSIAEIKGIRPTTAPSATPTVTPSIKPSASPSIVPTVVPSVAPTSPVRRRFIIRQDDIQDFYESSQQVELLNYFMDNNIGVSAAIIGNAFAGEDVNLYTALRRCAALSADKCALANRGLDSSYLFSSATTVTDAKAQIAAADTKIKSLFAGYRLQTFIPYSNSWNPNTLQAVKDLGYDAISASVADMSWDRTSNPLQFPQRITTAGYSGTGVVGVSAEDIISKCNEAAFAGADCVITVNAHEFAVGVYTMTTLNQLINGLKTAGFASINFATAIAEVKGIRPTASPTAVPTAVPSATPTAIPTEVPTAVPSAAPTSPVRRRFIIRQDDIQDFYESSQQVQLLNFFMDHNIGVSAAIIGNGFAGEDAGLYTALQRCASLSADKCALANRGLDSSYLFNTAATVADAKAQIAAADIKIKSLFAGYRLQTFVPYSNSWNNNALEAVKELGYDAISASNVGMSWNLTSNPLQLPQQISTAVYNASGTIVAVKTEDIVTKCTEIAFAGADCVITVNAHEFAVGVYTLTMLQQLLGSLQAAGFSSTNFATIIGEKKGIRPTATPTMIPTAVPSMTPSVIPTFFPSFIPSVAPSAPVRRRFLFRLNDVQDFYESSQQVELLNYFMDQGLGVEAAIIGGSFGGQDIPLKTALQRCAALSSDKCALANRGPDSSFLFSNAVSVAEAKEEISVTDSKIKTLFGGYSMHLLVPYQDQWNAFTLEAAKQLGYSAVSGAIPFDATNPSSFWNTSSKPLLIPQQVTTAVYVVPTTPSTLSSSAVHSQDVKADTATETIQCITSTELLNKCNEAAFHGQDCVITVTSHEFAVGACTLTDLQALVTSLQSSGFTATNFLTLISEANGLAPTFTPTIKPSGNPTVIPTHFPSYRPAYLPSMFPAYVPSSSPSTKELQGGNGGNEGNPANPNADTSDKKDDSIFSLKHPTNATVIVIVIGSIFIAILIGLGMWSFHLYRSVKTNTKAAPVPYNYISRTSKDFELEDAYPKSHITLGADSDDIEEGKIKRCETYKSSSCGSSGVSYQDLLEEEEYLEEKYINIDLSKSSTTDEVEKYLPDSLRRSFKFDERYH
jgi:hypothetical protein